MGNSQYARHFSDQGFWNTLSRYAGKAGREVVEKALWLFYAARDPRTPVWVRNTIYGALGYFILPLDAVPDMLPIVGYSDDLAVMAAALLAVSRYIDEPVRQRARTTVGNWFG